MFGPVPRVVLDKLWALQGNHTEEMETAESDNPDARSTEDDFDSMEVLMRIELNMIEEKMVDLRLDFVAFAEQQFGHVDLHSLVRIEPVICSKYQ
jgi:hypothetical protein